MGPGTILKDRFAVMGFHPDHDCGCVYLVREMDDLGPTGCREQFDRILRAIVRKACKRGYNIPGTRLVISRMLRSAIRTAEKQS